MGSQSIPKLSLVAQYDDLCRYTKILTTGCEEEFKVFAEGQLNCIRKWKNTESETRNLKEKLASLEAEKRRLETQMKHIRSILEVEVTKRKQAEKEKSSMERQLALIKDVLLVDSNNLDNQTKEKLAFLSSTYKPNSSPRLETIEESIGSMLSDCDLTDDGLDGEEQPHRKSRRSKGKRKSSENKISPKRKKSDPEDSPFIDERLENNGIENTCIKKGGIRSNSEPAGNSPTTPVNLHVHRSDSDQFKFNTYDLRSRNTPSLSTGTPVGRYSTGGKLNRTHMFATKTIVRPEKCYPCGRNIGFCKQALKCQDCRIVCHPECENKCPVPCIPAINTPTKGSTGTIADYVSSVAPKIPALIVHCVNEIEMRGLKEIGLYRIPGSEREVKDLKEKFLRGRNVPSLNQADIHAVCGTVKDFLRSLSEPLIPKSSWQIFVEAADIHNEIISLNALNQAVVDLPQANRDTLAFLILHLQRVAESKDCKMTIDNLSKVFGPTILGYSASEPTEVNILNETKYQHKVMMRLLKLSSETWEKLLNVEQDVFHKPIVKTPETTPAPKGTRLGPIYSGQKPRNVTLGRTPLTPRNSKFSKSAKNYFSSPLLR